MKGEALQDAALDLSSNERTSPARKLPLSLDEPPEKGACRDLVLGSGTARERD